jgi:GNAT superfamily N-acetyltransferase
VIRRLRDDDISQLARLWRELRPDAMHSERGLRHLVESFPERAEAAHWVGDEDGVAAWAFAHRRWWRAGSNAYVWVGVLPGARSRGLGGELWELAERHVTSVGVEQVKRAAATATRGREPPGPTADAASPHWRSSHSCAGPSSKESSASSRTTTSTTRRCWRSIAASATRRSSSGTAT